MSLQALRNEIDTIRCYARLFKLDADLLSELVALREFRDQHPLPKEKSTLRSRPKSALVLSAEAHLLFGDYCERESRRLSEKLKHLEAGDPPAEWFEADEAERLRNDALGRRAVEQEAAAAAQVPA